MTDPTPTRETTWDDVLAAVGRRFWQLAPDLIREQGARDLGFTVTWQDLMAAVEDGIDETVPTMCVCGDRPAVTTLGSSPVCESCHDEMQAEARA